MVYENINLLPIKTRYYHDVNDSYIPDLRPQLHPHFCSHARQQLCSETAGPRQASRSMSCNQTLFPTCSF